MWFDLTDEQSMIQKLIRDFSEYQVAPGADERAEQVNFHKKYSIS